MAGQVWAVNSLGGFLSNNDFSEKVRMQAQPKMLFRNFVDDEPEPGEMRKGATSLFDKVRNVATAGGTLNETATIPKTNIQIVQDSVTVTEYGNSVPYTEKLTSLSRINVPTMVQNALTDDEAKVLDSAAAAQFVATEWKAQIVNTATTSFNTASSAPGAAGASMSDKNARDIIDQLKQNNVPTFGDGLYRAICSTSAIRGLFDFFEQKANLTTLGVARAGTVGQYYGCLWMEETSYLNNDLLGDGTSYGELVAFGADAVRERIITPEEIRIKIPTDFGRDQGIAWYGMTGFVTTWKWTTDAEAHIIHVTTS